MSRSVAEIKARERDTDLYISPHHADGGWHTTPGCEVYRDESELQDWQLLNDHILVEFIPPAQGLIIHPDIAIVDSHSREARVLKVGTGEREVVNFGLITVKKVRYVKPGDLVIVGPYSDWESQDGKFGIFQEDDVRGILSP